LAVRNAADLNLPMHR